MNAFVARADYSNTVMSYNPVAYWPLNDGPRGEVALNPGIAVPAFDVYSSGIVTSGVPGAIVADTNPAIAFDGNPLILRLLGDSLDDLPVGGIAAVFGIVDIFCSWFEIEECSSCPT